MQASCAPSIVPAGDAIRQPAIENDRYIAPDGTSLQLAVWPAITDPEKLPKAVILGIHGFGDYRNAWQQPAEIWAREGITTFAYDQRGFGSSPTRGRWAGTQTLVDDIKTMSGLLRSRYPGVPLYLAGESMGGALVLVASDNHLDVDGIIPVAARRSGTFSRHARTGIERRHFVLRSCCAVATIRTDIHRCPTHR